MSGPWPGNRDQGGCQASRVPVGGSRGRGGGLRSSPPSPSDAYSPSRPPARSTCDFTESYAINTGLCQAGWSRPGEMRKTSLPAIRSRGWPEKGRRGVWGGSPCAGRNILFTIYRWIAARLVPLGSYDPGEVAKTCKGAIQSDGGRLAKGGRWSRGAGCWAAAPARPAASFALSPASSCLSTTKIDPESRRSVKRVIPVRAVVGRPRGGGGIGPAGAG